MALTNRRVDGDLRPLGITAIPVGRGRVATSVSASSRPSVTDLPHRAEIVCDAMIWDVLLDPAVVQAASDVVGAAVRVEGPTARGESGSTFDVLVGQTEAILKVVNDAPGVIENQRRLVGLVDRLHQRGYPAPEYLAVGVAGGVVFTMQRRLPGRMLEPGPGLPVDSEVLSSVLPSVLDAVELQADTGDLTDPPWPGWLLDTIRHGGDGYCLHHTLRTRAETTELLERVMALAERVESDDARSTDIVHFDLNPANVLHVAGRLTGIVDWNVPFREAAQGDRGFDIATMLFYCYDSLSRDGLWERAVGISGPAWTSVYLAHLVLRQVEWTVRHRPGSQEEHRFIDIASRVLHDCEDLAR